MSNQSSNNTPKYIYGLDGGKPGDGSTYSVFRRPNWFEKHILKVKWEYKLVFTEYTPPEEQS